MAEKIKTSTPSAPALRERKPSKAPAAPTRQNPDRATKKSSVPVNDLVEGDDADDEEYSTPAKGKCAVIAAA